MSLQELSRSTSRRNPASRGKNVKGLSIAVAGCGYWGAKHVRVVSGLADVDEVVVVDPDPCARSAIAAAFPNVVTVADIDAALARVDGVIVATPPRYHAEVALKAIRAGKPVLVEKPLAATLAESQTLVSAAARHDSVLMVGHTFEFNPAVAELRRRMDAGELGEIHYIHSARLSLGLFRTDVNVVWDLAPHDISIMSYLLRSTPTTVRAWASSNVSTDVVDLAHFELDYRERGVRGYGHVSWLDPRKVRQVTVVGSEKMAVYDDVAEEKLRIFDRGVDHGRHGGEKLPLHAMPISYRYGDVISPHIDPKEPLMLEDRHFIECILGTAEPLSDGESGLAVVTVLDAIDRSINSGRAVRIAPTSHRSHTKVLLQA